MTGSGVLNVQDQGYVEISMMLIMYADSLVG